ncbi:MAG: D-alanyl-D-alanine carboxypeptidase/D-alanyl-D-alanine-endopeptidase, partial [Verrucomicrobiales bacterium]|nr:D-alanyl-D-alanine carboxypeptidase/D-alanyl-D-alanine-endopeptidase [Verrucomicrobiales bacterium]
MARWLDRPFFQQATWGVSVADAATGEVVFESNARRLLKPGSTAKLFTTALALDLLGAGYEIRTDLIPDGRLTRRGTLLGDLIIRGRGDGSFCERLRGNVDGASMAAFVSALREAGVRRVRGDLVLDDAFVPGSGVGTGWTWDDTQYYYGARATALLVDESTVDLVVTPGRREGDPVMARLAPVVRGMSVDASACRTGAPEARGDLMVDRKPGSTVLLCSGFVPAGGGMVTQSVAVLDPVDWFGERLSEALRKGGISLGGVVRVAAGKADDLTHEAAGRRVWTVSSRPVAELVRATMKPSQNLQAQLLFLQSGAVFEGTPNRATEAGGVRALEAFLRRGGIPTSAVRLDEGSGLSRSALVTPEAMVLLLRYMDRHALSQEYREALPVAGKDGTLRSRFRGTPLEGNLRA